MSDRNAGRGGFFDFSEVSNRRTFTFLAINAALGIGIAGFGLFTAKGTTTNAIPPEDIALVNQRPIYRSDFLIQAQTQFAVAFSGIKAEERHKVLDDMVDEELMVQRGMEMDLPSYDPAVRAALVAGVELGVYSDVLAKEPTEEELKAYYVQHRDSYSSIGILQIRDLIVDGRPEQTPDQVLKQAQDAVAQLRAGAQLDEVIRKFGLRDSGLLMKGGKPDTGDIFEFAAQANLSPKVYAVLRTLQSGQFSDPILDTDGLHMLVVIARKPPIALDYATVRPRVWTDFKNVAQDKVRNETIKYLRGKAQILVSKEDE